MSPGSGGKMSKHSVRGSNVRENLDDSRVLALVPSSSIWKDGSC
jgi:hypothetical protein